MAEEVRLGESKPCEKCGAIVGSRIHDCKDRYGFEKSIQVNVGSKPKPPFEDYMLVTASTARELDDKVTALLNRVSSDTYWVPLGAPFFAPNSSPEWQGCICQAVVKQRYEK